MSLHPVRDDQGSEKINIGQIVEDADGTLWITSSHGLLRLDPTRQELVRYHNNPLDVESLESDEMVFIFQDREGNTWTCFQVTEPNYFSRGPKSFENFTYRRGELVDPLVTSIYQDREGILWIGSMGGLNRIDRRTGTNTVPPGSGVRNEILSILEDPSGVLFAGTFHRGLERIDRRSGQMSAYVRGANSNFAKNPIMKLIYDRAGNLWAATYGGISRFDQRTGNFVNFMPDTQDSVGYQAITEDVDAPSGRAPKRDCITSILRRFASLCLQTNPMIRVRFPITVSIPYTSTGAEPCGSEPRTDWISTTKEQARFRRIPKEMAWRVMSLAVFLNRVRALSG